jgi:hypothetical protein
MNPRRVKVWWSIGSTLAVVGVLGLVPVELGVRGAVTWFAPGAALVTYFVFLMLAPRTGQRRPVETNAPPSIT